jgi:hypothetical protein
LIDSSTWEDDDMPARETTTEAPTIEILRSPQLAAILTPLLWEMTGHAAVRYSEAQLSRVMAAPLAAVRSMINEIRRAHGLTPIDPNTGEPFETGPSTDGQAPAEPEPAEAKS